MSAVRHVCRICISHRSVRLSPWKPNVPSRKSLACSFTPHLPLCFCTPGIADIVGQCKAPRLVGLFEVELSWTNLFQLSHIDVCSLKAVQCSSVLLLSVNIQPTSPSYNRSPAWRPQTAPKQLAAKSGSTSPWAVCQPAKSSSNSTTTSFPRPPITSAHYVPARKAKASRARS